MHPAVIRSVLSTFGHFHTFSLVVWNQWPLSDKSCVVAQLTCEHIGSWQGLFWRLWETWRPVFWRMRWLRDLLLLLWSPGWSSHVAERPLFLVQLGLLWTGLEFILLLNYSIAVNRRVGLKYKAWMSRFSRFIYRFIYSKLKHTMTGWMPRVFQARGRNSRGVPPTNTDHNTQTQMERRERKLRQRDKKKINPIKLAWEHWGTMTLLLTIKGEKRKKEKKKHQKTAWLIFPTDEIWPKILMPVTIYSVSPQCHPWAKLPVQPLQVGFYNVLGEMHLDWFKVIIAL